MHLTRYGSEYLGQGEQRFPTRRGGGGEVVEVRRRVHAVEVVVAERVAGVNHLRAMWDTACCQLRLKLWIPGFCMVQGFAWCINCSAKPPQRGLRYYVCKKQSARRSMHKRGSAQAIITYTSSIQPHRQQCPATSAPPCGPAPSGNSWPLAWHWRRQLGCRCAATRSCCMTQS